MTLPFRVTIGFLFLCYALAFTARPDVGVVAFVESTFTISTNFLIALYVLSGASLLFLNVRLPYIVPLLLPEVLTVAGVIVRAITVPTSSLASLVGHGGLLLLIVRELRREARGGEHG